MLEIPNDQIALVSGWPISPFPGLRPFRITPSEDESLIFYGRNRAKDEILGRLNTSHLVFVVGPSGCGKSSLIKVGVIPALEAGLLKRPGANWRTAEMRPGDRPVGNLAGALATFWRDRSDESDLQKQVYSVLSSDENGLWLMAETLAPRTAPAPLLILIDQFEEVFGSQITAQSESQLLLDLLVAFAAKPHPNLFFIVNMRTDFLGHCANFPKLADVINETLFITPVLRDSELKSAIALPPEPYHGRVEEKLVEAMVRDASSEFGYNPDHLPLMQHALAWLWNNRLSAIGLSGSPPQPDTEAPSETITLTYDDYAAHGGLTGILNEHAETLFAKLSEQEQRIAKVLFTRLSERDAENRYRRSPTGAETLIRLAGCEPQEFKRVVSIFSDPSVSFLDCRPSVNGADELIDVSHESLIRQWDRLRGWADEEAEKVRNFRVFAASAKQWNQRERSTDFLKAGAELEVWEHWWITHRPTGQWSERYGGDPAEESTAPALVDLANEYLVQSHTHYHRAIVRRRLKIAAAGAALVVIMAAIGAAIPVVNLRIEKAGEAAARLVLERTKYETAADRGTEVLNKEDPNLALLLALAWLREAKLYVPSLEGLAYQALQTPRPKAILSNNVQSPTATFSPDGRLLLMTKGFTFQVWDVNEIKLVAEFRRDNLYARRSVWSPGAEWIVGGTSDGRSVMFVPCSVAVLRQYFSRCRNTEDVTKPIGDSDTFSWPSALNWTGTRLLSGGFGAAPKLWDMENDPPEPTSLLRSQREGVPPESQPGPEAQTAVGFAFAFTRKGTLFALGGQDGSIRIHSTDDPHERLLILRIPRPLQCAPNATSDVEQELRIPTFSLAFNPADESVIASATNDGCVRLWKWSMEKQEVTGTFKMQNTGFFHVSFDSSGRRLAVTSDDGSVWIWQPGHPGEKGSGDLTVLRGHRHATWTAEFSRGTNLLASASVESVRIWTLLPALAPSQLSAAPDRFGSARVVSRNGPLTLHSAEGREISLMDADAGEGFVDAAFSRDTGRVLVADKRTLKLYDLRDSNEPIAKFNVPRGEWKAVGFLRDPDRIVGETNDGIFYAWPFFKDIDALIEFACKNLPVNENGAQTDLTLADQERFGLSAQSRACPVNSAPRPG
jgi:WD40 repeat protein